MSKTHLTATEAARRLGISESAIRKRIQAGSLNAKKKGRAWRIPLEEIEREADATAPERETTALGGNATAPFPQFPAEDTERHALEIEVEVARAKLGHIEEELTRTQHQLAQSTEHVDRLTVLLSNEQALRMQALPSPISWIKRLIQVRI